MTWTLIRPLQRWIYAKISKPTIVPVFFSDGSFQWQEAS